MGGYPFDLSIIKRERFAASSEMPFSKYSKSLLWTLIFLLEIPLHTRADNGGGRQLAIIFSLYVPKCRRNALNVSNGFSIRLNRMAACLTAVGPRGDVGRHQCWN